MIGGSERRGPAAPRPDVTRKLKAAFASQQSGDFAKAERLYRAVLRQCPDEFDALHLLGLIEYQRGRYPEALQLVSTALRSNGVSADAWSNLGLIFDAQGEHTQALDSYDRALAIRPSHADALNNRGTVLNRLDRRDAALESFTKAVTARPDYVAAHFNRGTALLDLGRAADALASFDAALKFAPDHADVLCHRGNALIRLGRVEETVASYALAVHRAPENPQILHNHAYALRAAGRPREALASAEQALRLKPDYADARFGQSLALLTLGDLRNGFAAYESRYDTEEVRARRRHFAEPLWLGERDLGGRTLLVHAAQGFGDTLQFARYVPLLAQRGAKVILEVQRTLESLLSGLEGASSVVASGEALPPFDEHCPLMSLPHAFGTELTTIPANVPYLAADPDKAARWAARLSRYHGRFRIGLVWAGESRKHDPNANAIDQRRSVTLHHLAPLGQITGAAFFSLQKGEPGTQALAPPDGMELTDLTAELHDFADTAALITNLDLVISVDTAVAHLAGVWGNRCGCCHDSTVAGDGSTAVKTARGTRRCGCFIRPSARGMT